MDMFVKEWNGLRIRIGRFSSVSLARSVKGGGRGDGKQVPLSHGFSSSYIILVMETIPVFSTANSESGCVGRGWPPQREQQYELNLEEGVTDIANRSAYNVRDNIHWIGRTLSPVVRGG